MSSLVLSGDTSGSITLSAPAVAGTTTITLPTISGGNFVVSDSSGNVGIGTSSPASKLDVNGAIRSTSGTTLLVASVTGGIPYIQGYDGTTSANNQLAFYTGATERMRIDSSGYVGIGGTPLYKLDLFGAGTGTNLFHISSGSTDNGGYIQSTGNDEIMMSGGARYSSYSAGVWTMLAKETTASGIYVHAAGIDFWTNPGLTIGNTFTMNRTLLLSSTGYLLVGYTSSNGAYKLQVNSQIFATSATIATSDARYKTNIEPISSALTLVNKLNPVSFDWKEHPVHDFPEGKTIGFLAQEVKEVLKDTEYVDNIVKANTCTIEPEEKDEEGNITKEAVTEEFLGIAEGNLIPLLTKAIQEQQTIIQDLKARIAILESK
jgi:hypothetical protein